MPKGVEHNLFIQGHRYVSDVVQLSVMPKGVEHSKDATQDVSGIWCNYQ